MQTARKITASALIIAYGLALLPVPAARAQADFNPHFILSDAELQDSQSWSRDDVQRFLDAKGSYLRNYQTADASGTLKYAADIIADAARNYQINPKYLLVVLQKEQSLITDDRPTEKQLDWATGYAVCDGCRLSDPNIQRRKGFGLQVDGAAGIMRWYYDNLDKPVVKKKDTPVRIDDEEVTPQNWATAFLYTYTPHLHGNRNFWRIWKTWFEQLYPNGTLLRSVDSGEYWLVQDNTKRHFKNKTALITRLDPKLAITVPEIELGRYQAGAEINFPNFSLLRTPAATYLLDNDTLRPFASAEVIRKLGYHPDEIIEVSEIDLTGLAAGTPITASSTAPTGVIYRITDLPHTYYLLKDSTLYPIIDQRVVEINFKNLAVEKRTRQELSRYPVADLPIAFANGTLLQIKDSSVVYVMEGGKKRRLADDDTFVALGYQRRNILSVAPAALRYVPEGEPIFINANLLSAKQKYLGDSGAPVEDLFTTDLPGYLVAEYPSGRIISGKNIDARRPIASLTKLLTAYEVTARKVPLSRVYSYDKTKHAREGSNLQLAPGDRLRGTDLLTAMLVGSANNAAAILASAAAGSEQEFVNAVNRRLSEWGADSTSLADATGLSAGNKSTARDLLKIFTRVLQNKQLRATLFATKVTLREVKSYDKKWTHQFANSNLLIKRSGRPYRILASKTGYTDEAQAVLVMLIEVRATKKQYMVITLGNPNYKKRFDEPHRLAEWISKNNLTIAAASP
ncbi:MAG: D-alanyl-D-alanine carboxypeptidase [Candidatus Magasanikbacteria bacterium]|nr:D-alanyl-D-alanine carboxypeptidase [Candidatus Magasanikbacteria bacterium]